MVEDGDALADGAGDVDLVVDARGDIELVIPLFSAVALDTAHRDRVERRPRLGVGEVAGGVFEVGAQLGSG